MTLKNGKAKGNRQERKSMALLEAAGYRCTHSGASLGAWDVIGISATDFVTVQVKSRDWPGAVEMEALLAFPCPPNCKKLIHRWRDGEKYPDVKEL